MTSSCDDRQAHPLGVLVRRVRTRGSRIRAGTPTASLPAGTSWVTTAPAPVLAPSPTSTGATSIVSTPRNAPSPIVVAVLARAVVVGGDRAGADVDALADLGVAEVAHVVLLRAGAEARVLELGEVADLGAAPDDAARPEVAERPDGRLVLDGRPLDDARPDARALARPSASMSWLPGADDAARRRPSSRRAG